MSLQRKGYTLDPSHSCGAALLTAHTAVTEALCVDGASPDEISLRGGSLQHASGGTVSKVAKVIVHPGYNSRARDNDIAVVQLVEGFPDLSTVSLPPAGDDPASGTELTIAGWGVTNRSATAPTNPLPKDMWTGTYPAIDRATCRQRYSVDDITDQMICAGVPGGGVGACNGDQGDPLLAGDVLEGVSIDIRGRYPCGGPLPDVATRVSSFISFINDNTVP